MAGVNIFFPITPYYVRENREWDRLMIRKLKDGQYRLYSRKKDPKTGKRRNLGTFKTRAAAEKHEREIQYFKRRRPVEAGRYA